MVESPSCGEWTFVDLLIAEVDLTQVYLLVEKLIGWLGWALVIWTLGFHRVELFWWGFYVTESFWLQVAFDKVEIYGHLGIQPIVLHRMFSFSQPGNKECFVLGFVSLLNLQNKQSR
jgi:hypothetical protein